ncbi:hypothetical protein BP6252_11288 [Coleophoma cylindrospora]|uniref:Uncharacterized protein n=1 Tax=Coleophoma cylindrospora TaxID=1849047 RepID=A0A3D8QPJ1_9HELO|nr:hypothetical protein BP6252_11288 [Coleophoma cylindrospora]
METALRKMCLAHDMIHENPAMWFRDAAIDDRDRRLLDFGQVAFLTYGEGSFVRKMASLPSTPRPHTADLYVQNHKKASESSQQTEWTVEEDESCKNLVWSAGGELYGFTFAPAAPVSWDSFTVNVNIKGAPGAGFDRGFLSTAASNIRIFRGPPESCEEHPWDAMILRDCTSNTTNLHDLDYVASRKWDILAMKMCEDYDHPWVVISMKDAGQAERFNRAGESFA